MTSNLFSDVELDERAFAIYLREALQHLLDSSLRIHPCYIMEFNGRMYNGWVSMNPNHKDPYLQQAREQMEQIQRTQLYRTVVAEQMNQR